MAGKMCREIITGSLIAVGIKEQGEQLQSLYTTKVYSRKLSLKKGGA
jgi:hypothetical protein